MIIYEIMNAKNGKRYIGMTTMRLAKRWWIHKNAARSGRDSALYNAIRKYGEACFLVREMATLMPGRSVMDLFDLERDLIAQEGTISPVGYNLRAGGEGVLPGSKFPGRKSSPWSAQRRANHERKKLGLDLVPQKPKKQAAKIWNPRERMTPEELSALRSATIRANREKYPELMNGKKRTRARSEGVARGNRAKANDPKYRESLKKSWADPIRREAAASRMRQQNFDRYHGRVANG